MRSEKARPPWVQRRMDIGHDERSQPQDIPDGSCEWELVEYREWVRSAHAPSGWQPSGVRQYICTTANSGHLQVCRKRWGRLATTVWRTTTTWAEAERARDVHRAITRMKVKTGDDVHRALLKQLMPGADPMTDLVTDISIEQLRTALGRKVARDGWVGKALRSWLDQSDLLRHTAHTEVLVALAHLVGLPQGASGPEAVAAVDRAVEVCALARTYRDQGYPWQWWAAPLGELPKSVLGEVVRRWTDVDSEAVSA